MNHRDFEAAFVRAPVPMLVVWGHELVIEAANDAAEAMIASGHVVGITLREALPTLAERGRLAALRDAMAGIAPQCHDGVVCRFEQGPSVPQAEATCWTVRCVCITQESNGKGRMVLAFDGEPLTRDSGPWSYAAAAALSS